MRLVTYLHEGPAVPGVRSGDGVVPLPVPDTVTLQIGRLTNHVVAGWCAQ
jgi:hypothetical protein